jgi:hypothetical protein
MNTFGFGPSNVSRIVSESVLTVILNEVWSPMEAKGLWHASAVLGADSALPEASCFKSVFEFY